MNPEYDVMIVNERVIKLPEGGVVSVRPISHRTVLSVRILIVRILFGSKQIKLIAAFTRDGERILYVRSPCQRLEITAPSYQWPT